MDAFTTYVIADIVGIVLGLLVYDWLADPLVEWLVKHRKSGVLKDQDIS